MTRENPTSGIAAPFAAHIQPAAVAPPTFIDVVAEPEAHSHRVRLKASGALASRAVSCLIEPRPGDTVLVAADGSDWYVLAVLARPGLADVVVSPPDPAATLHLHAQAVTISAATTLRLSSPETSIVGTSVRLVADALTWFGRSCTLFGERLLTSVRHNDTVAERISTKTTSRVSIVDGLDSEQLGSKVSTVDTVSTATSQASVTAAREDLRFDAQRITLG